MLSVICGGCGTPRNERWPLRYEKCTKHSPFVHLDAMVGPGGTRRERIGKADSVRLVVTVIWMTAAGTLPQSLKSSVSN